MGRGGECHPGEVFFVCFCFLQKELNEAETKKPREADMRNQVVLERKRKGGTQYLMGLDWIL